MSKRPLINGLVLATALLIGAGPIVGPYVVRAAGARTGRTSVALERTADSSPIANVDMQRLYEESEARVQAESKVRAFSVKSYQNFEETTKLTYVTPEEIEEFSRIINDEKQPDAKRLAAIRASSAARGEEFQKLSAKPQSALTVEDRKKISDLTKMAQQQPVLLDRLQKFYQEAVDEESNKQRRLGFAEVRAAVQKLAKDQGFTQVYDVTALVYAPNDITEQALKKVKAKSRENKG